LIKTFYAISGYTHVIFFSSPPPQSLANTTADTTGRRPINSSRTVSQICVFGTDPALKERDVTHEFCLNKGVLWAFDAPTNDIGQLDSSHKIASGVVCVSLVGLFIRFY
jgi:hypothetical protein